ncbi:hypothetical protein VHEMI06392 [[Torrubiella] hemipterigena]|uniref:HhH-GPD domain-containing protein n=1 Tax=[Torrubiella] hemipterigena TaxID=1531966 RepID=A0A0A1T754_9HYPO|nr:hypothetical protein VHEMI06392 [[Torrubiella] hemipterigena]
MARSAAAQRQKTAPTRHSLRSHVRITKAQSTIGAKTIKTEPTEEELGNVFTIKIKEEQEGDVCDDTKEPVKSEHGLAEDTILTSSDSPFPTFAHPTPKECELVHATLVGIHGERTRPSQKVAPKDVAGCGTSQSVLDALVRTILSQNTSNKNSTRAKKSMDAVYGSSDNWEAIVKGCQPKLQEAIRTGGLSVTKSKAIINLLTQVYEKYGKYSLDHLFEATNDEAMSEMMSYGGVGPKTASCVLLFCLERPSFAVDTHVYRLTGLLGWRPAKATREQAQEHLDATVPDHLKYPLHVLFIAHGRTCERCKATGRGGGGAAPCKLRNSNAVM